MLALSVCEGMTVQEGIHAIFCHYACKTSGDEDGSIKKMDGLGFTKMCKEAPELTFAIGRHDVDLIFSKCKPVGERRLNFENFLDTILGVSILYISD